MEPFSLLCHMINIVIGSLSLFPSYHDISGAFRHYQLLINVIQGLRLLSLFITQTTSCPPAHRSHSWSVFHQLHFYHYISCIKLPSFTFPPLYFNQYTSLIYISTITFLSLQFHHYISTITFPSCELHPALQLINPTVSLFSPYFMMYPL